MSSTMNRLRVLKLGCEFPPLINEGLGIACLGLSRSFAKPTNDLLTDAARVTKIYEELASWFAFNQLSHKLNA